MEKTYDLPLIAKRLKSLNILAGTNLLSIVCIIAIVAIVGTRPETQGPDTPPDSLDVILIFIGLGAFVISLGAGILIIFAELRMMTALQRHGSERLLILLGLFVPFVLLGVLISLICQATKLLRDNGYKIGLVTAKPGYPTGSHPGDAPGWANPNNAATADPNDERHTPH